ncbi:hypothetical protein QE109_13250 [Fusibacter bizertensis]|jgi:hypothetical protein|uniref:Uncharacterized protein n=1 Tax=Fusibacter bizertensis TaxID=1488331 RepID=A0ABT6NFH8_9FIRM|nr:hypothetical protein [Fusibacter bizertensis]MDH8679120.1 hypothetical protein [Fusibacter bizertensis]
MSYQIDDLKEAVNRLSDSLYKEDPEEVDMYVRMIKNIATQIKNDYWSIHVNEADIVIQPVQEKNKGYKTINTLEFLYKPMYFQNIYEGNEIEFFSKERTEELNESGVMEAHNDFWQAHEIIYGNVYGSLPIELASKEGIAVLLKCGWKKSSVDIVEFSNDMDIKKVRGIAEKKYRHYILLKELETQTILLLRYNF